MSRVPRLSTGVNVMTLPLRPAEAFLISRIDGVVDERELVFITGMEPAAVSAALARLVEFGVITFDKPRTVPQPTPIGHRPLTQPGANVSSVARSNPPIGMPLGRLAEDVTSDSPPLYDPSELDEPVDLEPEKKRRILDIFYRLDDLNYYELLGLGEQSEKKQIKSAYYVLAPEFHPDKFFRKNLGSFKPKIEAIFGRFTLAYDVLTSKQKRPEYDSYLEQTHRNRTMAALLDQSQRDIAAVRSAVEESAKALVSGTPAVSSVPPPTPGRYIDASPSRPGPPSRVETMQSRRASFARKIAGSGFRASAAPPRPGSGPPSVGSMPPGPTSGPPPAVAVPPIHMADALRVRYDAARGEAARQQIARYVESAKVSLERKDFASAANAYRIAASLAPADASIQAACTETAKLAATALADGFLRQADYEAHNERWSEAALSYAKVCSGRPEDPRAHERVAYSTILSRGNARRAVDFARRAVELAPKVAEYHLTLARAYLAAGLDKSANGEIDRAIELAPGDAKIQAMVQGLRDQPMKDGKVG